VNLIRHDARRDIRWPKHARVAVSITFDFEAEEDCSFRQDATAPVDWREFGEREFGGKRGIWRVLDVLGKHDKRCTFFACGATIERYREATRAIVSGGHELGGHAYHHEYFDKLTAEDEIAALNRMMAAFEDVVGARPAGFRSCSPSSRTLANLLDLGIRFDSTNLDQDLPYLVEDERGRTLLEVPNGFGGDVAQYGHPVGRHLSSGRQGIASMALESWKRDFAFAYERGEHHTEMMLITLHPYSSGRPSRALALDRFFEFASTYPDVWYPTVGEIADWWQSQLRETPSMERLPQAVA
jgi:peptidoglycan-N-acetylglucosamine deacetylase